ncbi:bifunctional pyr operon transcriptional regulator/uracil phosphoribosyltransferase PyrR [candidate division KSB1 bacterium]|jgi:pyrimidine operon attenuation protein/uracil phosphoribosyltransferase|nr:bifunctional pyr operon transcriptional regulator/uracil phosphoribosyltransferase PyrR [candidate division KSB1 bacterium]
MKVIATIIDESGLDRTINRLAYEIIERNRGVDRVVMVGIRSRGVEIAHRLQKKIHAIENKPVPLGSLDVTLYRDDFRKRLKQPDVQVSEIPFNIDEKHVILIDDVLYTGRTSRAALDALLDFGRPASVQLAVLVDRGHREMPIKADYIGKSIPTLVGEEVRVKLREVDGEDAVLLVQAPEENK